MDSVKDLEKSETVAEQELETTEPIQNGLDSTCASVPSSPIEKNRLTEPTRLVLPDILFLLPLGGAKLSMKKLEFVISLQCQHTKSVFTPAIIEIDKLSTREVCVTPRQITVNKVQTLVKYNVTKMSTSVVVLGLFLFLNEPVHLSTILFNNV